MTSRSGLSGRSLSRSLGTHGTPWDPWDPRPPKKLRPWEVKKATCDRLARTGHDLGPRRQGGCDPRDGGLSLRNVAIHCLNPQNS